MGLRIVGIICALATLTCGARQTDDHTRDQGTPQQTATASPVDAPAPLAGTPTASARKSLAELVESADSILVGLVTLSSPTRHGCQDLHRLYVQPLAFLRGGYSNPRLRYLLAASAAKGAGCTGDELDGFAATGPLSFHAPMVLFVDNQWVQRGSNGPEVPPLYGTEAIGQQLLGAAPLEALAELGKHLPTLDSDLWLIPPLSPQRFELQEAVAVDRVTGLMWQRVGPAKAMREVPAQQYCKKLTLAGHTGWRLPSVLEATSLYRHESSIAPAPAEVFTKLTKNWYWTGTDDDGAFVYSPGHGGLTSTHYDDPSPYGSYDVLCVRSHLARARVTSLPGPRFLHGADFVRDAATRRLWYTAKKPALHTLKQARQFCGALQAAGKSDWRLPTLQEALTLVVVEPVDDYDERALIPVNDDEDAMWTMTRVSDTAEADEVVEVRYPGSLHYWSAGAMGDDAPRRNAICVTSDDGAELAAGTPDLRYATGSVLSIGKDAQASFFHERGGPLWTRSGVGDDRRAEARYPSGQLAASGAMRAGVRVGEWRFWDPRGQPLATVTFAGGFAAGQFTFRDSDHDYNSLDLAGSMHSGRFHGPLIARSREGKVVFEAEFCRGLACGKFQRFNDKATLIEAGEFRDGKAIGDHLAFHDDGKRSLLTRYKEGKLHGISEGWHPSGQPSRRLSYRDGRRHGEQMSWYPSGATKLKGEFADGTGTETHYYENGQRSLVVDYTKEVRTGRWFRWHQNGQRSEESRFRNGKHHGVDQSWHDNGKPRTLVTYRDGVRVGTEKRWHDNGKLASVRDYVKGISAGKLSEWDKEGRPSRTGSYRNGRRHGLWTQYYEGKKVRDIRYRDGETIDRIEHFGD